MNSVRSRLFGVALIFATSIASGPARSADDVLVFAAASLRDALDAVASDWSAESGTGVVVSYAGSSALARQIQQGAPADIFISASTDWMEALEASGDLREGTRRDLLGNTLVLIAHGAKADPVDLATGFDLAGLLGDERLAMPMVDSVPAGVYGREALTFLGMWDEVAPRVAQTDNVRAALALVAAGEAPYGIVYATDAEAQGNVAVIAAFPLASHTPIVYPAALVAGSRHAGAVEFLDFLGSDSARAVFEREGFAVLD